MILEARNLKKHFKNGRVKAVEDVSFSIRPGTALGVVGESGSGKSTIAKLALRLLPVDGGEVYFDGRNVTHAKEKDLKDFRKQVQIVFQEPYLSLNPRMRVKNILKESFLIRKSDTDDLDGKVKTLLSRVELSENFASKFPHEMSGGECQRVAIARALSTNPRLIVCDEPVSSLDAIVQAQILKLFLRIQKEQSVAYLFISHDLKVVRHLCADILIMKDGQVCESGPRERIFGNPEHPYTRLLIQNLR